MDKILFEINKILLKMNKIKKNGKTNTKSLKKEAGKWSFFSF